MGWCNSVELTYQETDVILNRAKDYYENDKKRLIEPARKKCRNLSEEEKNKNREYRKADTATCQKKKTMAERISKKLSRG